ncbi:MAG: sulfatase-like hydrolase/transferase [Pirellulales bacterium]|nr:sulfatase-like hydrolase/transferase [Pirellulales bacterium]
MNVICVVIDRLHVGMVGAYGNAWVRTPAMDQLACEGFTFDQVLATGASTAALCRSAWRGEHPLSEEQAGEASLAELLGAAGVATTLLTDDPDLAAAPASHGFGQRIVLPLPGAEATAEDVDQTHLAGCFARVIEHLDTCTGPFLTWVHLSSLGRVWDAPYDLRARYAEADDPPPPESATVPRFELADDADPDLLLGITQSYAGQVTLLDMGVGALTQWLEESPVGRETLLVLLSARGFPLGEHGRVGAWDETLSSETVHVPMMVRLPGVSSGAGRGQALVTPADLCPTLLEWWSVADPSPGVLGRSLLPLVRGEADAVRDRFLLGEVGGETALRTPAWYLRRTDPPRLFFKPDDRWEVSDVADRCQEVVARLEDVAQEYQQQLQAGQLDELSPLDETLLVGPD